MASVPRCSYEREMILAPDRLESVPEILATMLECAERGCGGCARRAWALAAEFVAADEAMPAPLRDFCGDRLRRVGAGKPVDRAMGVGRAPGRPTNTEDDARQFDLARADFFLREWGWTAHDGPIQTILDIFAEVAPGGAGLEPKHVQRARKVHGPTLMERDADGACKLWLGWERFEPIKRKLREADDRRKAGLPRQKI